MTVVGVPAEIKADEHRVALTPAGARELADHGHTVLVQAGAGARVGMADGDYAAQGAEIVPDARAVFERAELIAKVKEPQPGEVAMLAPQHTIFTFLHLASAPQLTHALMASGATCIAFETVRDAAGRLPLLAPMSEIAGRVAAQAAAFMLERPHGGPGVLLGGAPGVAPARAMVIGSGVVGTHAATVLAGLGAEVAVYDRSLPRLRELDGRLGGRLGGRCHTRFASVLEIEAGLRESDVVIGAVLVPGARAPRVLRREQLALVKPGALLVDVSIDQGGCFETSHPTTHSDPVFEVDGVRHYCVANMPSAVPLTATHALTNATLPYVVRLAEQGAVAALLADEGLLAGLAVCAGRLTSAPVAAAVGERSVPARDALGAVA